MRRRRHLACHLLTAAVAVGGCGGDDGIDPNNRSGGGDKKLQRSTAGDAKGAEGTVRDYLRALVDGNGGEACAKLTPEYQKSVVEQNRDFAAKAGVKDCASLIEAVVKQTPRTTFEGRPLNEKTVDTIPLKATVRQNGQEQNATVTGTQGLQRYELYTTEGNWAISEVVQAGG